jgi:hypothetical protein
MDDDILDYLPESTKEQLYKENQKKIFGRRRLPQDYKIIATSNIRHYCQLVGSDARLKVDGNPVVDLRVDVTLDTPIIDGSRITLNYNRGYLKNENKILREYFQPIKEIPKSSGFSIHFILGNETSKGLIDQIPQLLHFENIIGVHWRDIYDIEKYGNMIYERIIDKYLWSYWARWSSKKYASSFVGPMGVGPTADRSMIITDCIALPLTG